MKISIITPTFNNVDTFADTLESISRQSYKNTEHIIMDGGSTDGTLDMARAYAQNNPNVRLISEKDKGIYDAMNKGINIATGEIIAILNSDDYYTDHLVLEKVIFAFKNSRANACYGDLVLVSRDNTSNITRYWQAGSFDPDMIDSGWSPPHPALFVKKHLYRTLGDFSLDYRIASDYDFMFRLMKSKKVSFAYIPQTLVHMRDSGTSSNSLRQRIKGWGELKRAWIKNGHTIPKFFILRRIILKLPQYLKAFRKKK